MISRKLKDIDGVSLAGYMAGRQPDDEKQAAGNLISAAGASSV